MAQGLERTEDDALELIEPMLGAIRSGVSLQQACDYYGIHRTTVTRLQAKFESVARKIQQAEADYLVRMHKSVERDANKDGNLAMKVLSKRDKQRWGDAVDVTSGGQPIQVIDFTRGSNGPEPDTKTD